jgi:hypothetical protein
MDEVRFAGNPFQDHIVETGPTKRPNSLQSLQSLQSLRSPDAKPKVPPKKRQKLNDYMASRESFRDPYADLGLAFDPADQASSSQPAVVTHPRGRITDLVNSPSEMDVCPPRHRTTTPDGMASVDGISDVCMVTSAASSLSDLVLTEDKGKGKWEPDDMGFDAPFATVNVEQLEYYFDEPSEPGRKFDSSHPIDTFSDRDIQDMKLAADFLHMLGFDGDAFPLYVLLLKRSKQSSYASPRTTTSAMIACTRSAYWSSQVQLARTLWEPKFEARGASTDVEHFLFRMLLADTYARLGDYEIANMIIEHTMGCEFATEGLLLKMPYENRSLDLLTYQYLTQGLCYKDDLVRDGIASGDIEEDYPLFEKSQFALCFLHQTPGPFALHDDEMKNPCIRSCLRWCVAMLESTAMMTDSWVNTEPDKQDDPSSQHIGLFCCLWECWQSRRDEQETSEAMKWTSQAEKLMGISAAELLGTICWMIVRASPPVTDSSDSDLVLLRGHAAADLLLMLSDKELSLTFLEESTYFDTRTRMCSQQKAFRTTAREYARSFIERSLGIVLPEAQGSYAETNELNDLSDYIDDWAASASPRTLGIVAKVIHETLAPSLNSSNWSTLDQSFRTMRIRIKKDCERLRQNAAEALPSSAFAGNSMSNLISMDELSDMASSLSIDSFRTAGTSVLQRASTVSSGVRERVMELERGPLGDRQMSSMVY